MLARADLPLETIALAVCILDSLNARFALSFRRHCPLTPPPYTSEFSQISPHIDAIHPELLILAALILAVKFLDDAEVSTGQYARLWGNGLWSCEQINFAQKAIMENIGWRIKPLWEEGVIRDAMRDMRMAAVEFEPVIYDEDEEWEVVEVEGMPLRGMGKAVLGFGALMTPMDTPTTEERIDGGEPFPKYVEPRVESVV